VLVDRRKPGQVTFKKIASILQEGLSLIVFPEGTRSVDGRIGSFKKAIFVLAIEAGLSIVPVSVSGSHRVMKPGRLTTCPGIVSLTVHAPVETSLLTRNDALDLADRVKRTIASAIYHEM
jgi:1-acyl-sn-glycerol-3-phosphate acyltransferase